MKFYDTCSVMEDNSDLSDVVISSITIQELENIKTSSDKSEDIRVKSRKAVNQIRKFNVTTIIYNPEWDEEILSMGLEVNNDNRIIMTCCKSECDGFYTEDYLCGLIAEKIFNLTVKRLRDNITDEYKGYKEFNLSEEEYSEFLTSRDKNKFELLINQYAIIKVNGEIIDFARWDGESNVELSVSKIGNDFMGKVKPRNDEQRLAFDMLQNDAITIKVLTGDMGTGKDYCMVSHAVQMLKNRTMDKIVLVRNNIEVKGTKEFGFLPNGMDEKLEWLTLPIQSALGGKEGYEMFASKRQIEILPLNWVRGADIKNSIVYVTEAENMTKEHIQLLIARIGEGSQLWINGDTKQIDDKLFEYNNGLETIINKLKGNKRFGVVNLAKVERSETAELAKLLDD